MTTRSALRLWTRVFAYSGGVVITLALLAYWLRTPLLLTIAERLVDPHTIALYRVDGFTIDSERIFFEKVTLSIGGGPRGNLDSKGALQILNGVELRYTLRPLALQSVDIRSIQLTPLKNAATGDDGTPLTINTIVAHLTALPLQSVSIDAITLSMLPQSLQLHWQKTVATTQQLTLRCGATQLDAHLTISTPTQVAATTTLRHHNIDVLTVNWQLQSQNGTQYTLTGDADLALAAMLPLASDYAELLALPMPASIISAIDGRLLLHFSASMSDTIAITPTTPWQLAITSPSGINAAVDTRTLFPAAVKLPATWQLHFPWPDAVTLTGATASAGLSGQTPKFSAVINGDSQQMQVQLDASAVHCSTKPLLCRAHVALDGYSQSLPLPALNVEQISAKVAADIAINSQATTIILQPDSSVTIRDLQSAQLHGEQIVLKISTPLTMTLGTDSSLLVSGEQIELQLPHLTTPILSVATQVSIQKLRTAMALDNDDAWQASFTWRADQFHSQHAGNWLPTLRLNGEVTFDHNALQLSGAMSSDRNHELLTATAQHDFATGRGLAQLANSKLRFGASKSLSSRFSRWPYAWNIHSGTITAASKIQWQPRADTLAAIVDTTVQFDKLDVTYGDIAGFGVTGNIHVVRDRHGALTSPTPLTLDIDTIDVGLPISQLHMALNINADQLQLQTLNAQLLGGQLLAQPTTYYLDRGDGELLITLLDLQLPQLIALAANTNIEASGRIDGALPLSLRNNTLTMAGGWLAADAPGGVIRYLSSAASLRAGESNAAIQLTLDVLSNYHYHTLQGYADYAPNGDLYLRLQIKGRNPDLALSQPIHFNPSLTNNIPDLLHALQASRAVPTLLEQRFSQ